MSTIKRTSSPIQTGPAIGKESVGNGTATVQSGETKLAQVSKRLNIALEALTKANPQIREPNALKAGQDIYLAAIEQASAPPAAPPPQKPAQGPLPLQAVDTIAKSLAQMRLNEATSAAQRVSSPEM